MYTKRTYSFWMTFNWSKWPFIIGFLYSGIICLTSHFTGINLTLPWGPIGVIGIAVAFYLGFKNNSSYDRTWEARKIWGSIVNNSRTFGAAVISFVQGDGETEVQKELIYRHLAWLTALRHQLRLSRPWEHTENRVKGLYAPTVCEDYTNKLEDELSRFLPEGEIGALRNASNKATQILRLQSQRLQQFRDLQFYEDFRHMEFHTLITSFYADQGKSERIKNFPFPRQYASATIWLTLVFCAFVPFGLLDITRDAAPWMIVICPFLSGLITWVFFLMEKIGDYSENPFEGTYNDVPITAISRAIEIDLLEMLGEQNVPEPVSEVNGFLM